MESTENTKVEVIDKVNQCSKDQTIPVLNLYIELLDPSAVIPPKM